ncbi:MAG: PIN domain-containing protein [Deltaproteobacteria bacterium]|nr:PIN domain-containing protein [Deltaproteobacteria bacterium]
MIYLDTHVILWLYLRKGEGLSDRARELIEYEDLVLISPMVLLELDYLHEIGRTTVGSSQVFDYLHQRLGLQICQKAFMDVVRKASQLSWTRDPFDRMITAQSAIDRNTLITKDKIIRKNYDHAVW